MGSGSSAAAWTVSKQALWPRRGAACGWLTRSWFCLPFAAGCVRLWDVRLSDETPANGTVLAQADYDINAFSLGDVYSGERPLVV